MSAESGQSLKSLKKSKDNLETLKDVERKKEHAIVQALREGKPYQEICKDERVSPKRIAQIKHKYLSENEESLEVRVMKMLMEGKTPVEVLIATGAKYEEIKKLYAQFADLSNTEVISKNSVKRLCAQLGSLGYEAMDFESMKRAVEKLVAFVKEVQPRSS